MRWGFCGSQSVCPSIEYEQRRANYEPQIKTLNFHVRIPIWMYTPRSDRREKSTKKYFFQKRKDESAPFTFLGFRNTNASITSVIFYRERILNRELRTSLSAGSRDKLGARSLNLQVPDSKVEMVEFT